jgi:hypothetical protein
MATDRAALLRSDGNPTKYTGIDFIHVEAACDQTRLRIYLLTDATELLVPFHELDEDGVPLRPEDITIRDASDPNAPPIRVIGIDAVDGSQVLFDTEVERHYIGVTLERAGDFSQHRLRIDDPNPEIDNLETFSRIDRFFNNHAFSFKAGCPDRLDCLAPAPFCPPPPSVDFPVDYLARDFVSLRNALLEFGAQRYPEWSLPIEADVGVMFMEVMAALGDELSYIQDRYAREAFLETATERRSVRRKTRLLDFEMHDGRSATTLLEIQVEESAPETTIRAGSRVFALSESFGAIPFEVGRGLVDTPFGAAPTTYEVHDDWNAGEHLPFTFDDGQVCLDVGTTELFVEGAIDAIEALINDPNSEDPPRFTLLRSGNRQHLVRLVSHETFIDPLQNQEVTRLTWDARDALPFQMDLVGLQISFNIVPATAGERRRLDFARAPFETLPDDVLAAVEREGPLRIAGVTRERLLTPEEAEAEQARLERPPIVFFGLLGTEAAGLGFLGDALRHTTPELQVIQNPETAPIPWQWRRSLIDADPTEPVFTLEDGIWQRVRAFSRLGTPFVHQDYATGAGFSVRFGDGQFGIAPPQNDPFRVIYRTAPGTRANVPPGAVNALAFGDANDFADQTWIVAATNPFPVTNGVDPETVAQAKQLASEAYQSETFFAVRPRDYGRQAEKLEFVQRAQGTARWTGTWTSLFVATDPFGSSSLTDAQRDELDDYMNCVRQTGRDVIVRDPKTIAVDLRVVICLEPHAHASHILAQLSEVMFGPGTNRRVKGFFHPDHFTFGTPLRRSALEATIQRVPGVLSVRSVAIRRRGLGPFRAMREVVKFGSDQILRLENDPARPEGGTLTFRVRGGV